ncbi:MAG: HEAT repeat domain-containing protein [Verrucomicrobia bacterium]|nr:HEAT repeat domain-containing protein [Verrucomicrobiota bacterium]
MATDARLNPLDELQRAAGLANQMDPRNVAALAELLRAGDSAVRWWGAVGLLALRGDAVPSKPALLAALDDSSPDVRIAVAETVAHLGALDRALPILGSALRTDDVFARLSALNAAHRLGPLARPLLPAIRQAKLVAPNHKDVSDYVGRIVEYLPGRIGD